MLKLNYNEYGLFLEQVNASMDALPQASLWEFATQRVMLAVYAGETLHIEPGRAAFLLPANTPGVTRLERVLQADETKTITLTTVDGEFVEVSLQGTWIANSAQAEAGTFITSLTPESETLVYQLWQATKVETAIAA